MAKYSIEDSTLIGIADAIREKEDSSDVIPVSELAGRISALNLNETGPADFRYSDLIHSNLTSGKYEVAFANHIYIAWGGAENGIYYSEDGKYWNLAMTGGDDILVVQYINNIWITGVAGSIYTSVDGKTWTKESCTGFETGSGRFNNFSYGNGMWLADFGAAIYYSSDRKTWTKSNFEGGTWSIVYADGTWVASTVMDTTTAYWSTDGRTWTATDIPNEMFCTIFHDGVTWNAVGTYNNIGIMYSEDGKTWLHSNINTGNFGTTSRTQTKLLCSGALDLGTFWYDFRRAYADGVIYYTIDGGRTWIEENKSSFDYHSVARGRQTILRNGSVDLAVTKTNLLRIKDPQNTYKTVYYSESPAINTIIGGLDVFIAYDSTSDDANNHGLFYVVPLPGKSDNGTVWTKADMETDMGNVTCICDCDGTFVASTFATGLWYSTDGRKWFQSNETTGDYQWCSAGNGMFVATGSAGLKWSSDGVTWTASNITASSFIRVCYFDGLWVASNLGSGLYYSADGKTWKQSNITSGMFYGEVHRANGLWVGCGYGSGLYYSTDGKTWTQSNIKTGQFISAHYANGLWVAVTFASDDGIYYSTDGKIWSKSNVAAGSFYDVHYGNGVWAACNSEGLYYSEDGMSWSAINTGDAVNMLRHANGIWVAAGDKLLYSLTGKSWCPHGNAFPNASCVHYANGIWVAGDNKGKGIYYSIGWAAE